MDYQEIVTAYKNRTLDIGSLRENFQITTALEGRPKYRALDMVNNSFELNNKTLYLLTMTESLEKSKVFIDELDKTLNDYFATLISEIKKCKAWDLIGLVPKGWSQAEFETLSILNKFKSLNEINKMYYKFLDLQKLADLRDRFSFDKDISDENIYKYKFIIMMFDSFKNDDIKKEFFCFNKRFLMALKNFKRSKTLRLDQFMESKGKTIYFDYKKYSNYFSTEDFRDIIENITLVSKTLKISITKVIECFAELSETEVEKQHLKDDAEELRNLQKKFVKMNVLKNKYDKLQEIERQKRLKKEQQDYLRKQEEEIRIKAEEERKHREEEKVRQEEERIIASQEGSTNNLENQVEENNKKVTVREQILPLYFSWFEQENTTLARRISLKKLVAFFEKIKQIQLENGVRISLFLITNSNEEQTILRMQEIQKRAQTQGLPNLVEGAFGGYSTFKVERDGKVIPIAQMSDINREKIKNLLEKPVRYYLPKENILDDEKDFLRYQFSEKKNRYITIQYLKTYVAEILKDERVKKQPIKLLPYIERNGSGIDVLLESQIKGISKLPEYYASKYAIAPGKALKVDVLNIDSFIGDMTKNIDESNSEVK